MAPLTTLDGVKVAFAAESFLPAVNGVTNSVLHMLNHLREQGHDAVVFATHRREGVPGEYAGFPVETFPSFSFPLYPEFRVNLALQHRFEAALSKHKPDVVHLASPFMLGYKAALAAAQQSIPIVAIYQTEVPAYASRYNVPAAEPMLWHRVRQIHTLACATYAPSTFSRDQLIAQGIPRVGVWGRGVDSALFHPARRDEDLHREWAPNGERVVGYMGRLANEKQIEHLAVLRDVPNTRFVIIGEGPARESLERELPNARFLGLQKGTELARSLATLDLFVHPGEMETFGQAIQEALASGVPVIAPRRGGPIDLVDPSRTGWLYQPGDLDALRGFAVDLLGDDAKRLAFGRAARASVENNTWPNISAQMVDHYHEAISSGIKVPTAWSSWAAAL